ncbi:MAG: PBP1A family penicillin-binding protein [Gammaproteobacteria bacterium]|nr:PBP1A family penicillin-binding protein [Gammaproteobacteria bacterium]MDE0258881.1 PBP1A family penicillin-binding protein [Gammaproteobacteria bacterium]
MIAPTLLATAGLVLGFMWGSWRNLCNDCPSIAQIYNWEPRTTSKLLARDGRLIQEFGIQRRTPVAIGSLPAYVPGAFVAVEDKRFYNHGGLDPIGIARAARDLILTRSLEHGGGSTLTQQLARNIWEEDIGYEKRLLRKLKEAQVALELERAYSKEQILEAYMNQVNYDGVYGIEAASLKYFGKPTTQVNPAEAALLAAIPNRPRRYNPFLNPQQARSRRNLVLRRMAEQGYISAADLERWAAVPLPTPATPDRTPAAPYFAEWIRQILDDRYGSQLYTAGLEIQTTLDLDMQFLAERAMEEGFRSIEVRPGFKHPRYGEFAEATEALQTPYVQGAMVVLDPVTGEVLAMVGGRDFVHSKFNRATQALRQPGSSFKPFVYAAAVESGIPPSHIVVDAPFAYMQVSGEPWLPQNFDETFKGGMTIRQGLRESRNMIAIRLGWDDVGIETVAQMATRLGLSTEIPRFPSTTIGAAEVLPIDMAKAYASFATLGTRVEPHGIVRVENAEGEVLWEPQPEKTAVLDSLEARVMVHMLEDVVARGTGYRAIRLVAGLPYEVPAAGKTGTTNNSTDAWFNGFTPDLHAIVWFGMDQPEEIRPGSTGGGDAAPVWGNFMRSVYYGWEGEEDEPVIPALREIPDPWPLPEKLIRLAVDDKTGLLASEWCPETQRYTEIFIPGTEPTEPCDASGIFGGSRATTMITLQPRSRR